MKKVLITSKAHPKFGLVGNITRSLSNGYIVEINGVDGYFTLKGDCEVLLPLSEIVKAWEDGKEIEFWRFDQKEWTVKDGRPFFPELPYRIAPDPKEQITPYTWEDRDLLRGLWVKSKSTAAEVQVIYISNNTIGGWTGTYTYDEFHDKFTHLDGMPLGKKI